MQSMQNNETNYSCMQSKGAMQQQEAKKSLELSLGCVSGLSRHVTYDTK
jgi:hypothetical protein